MLRRLALVRTDVSEELNASFIRVSRIGELGTMPAPSSPILVTLMKEALSSSDTSVLTRATRHNIPEGTILHEECRLLGNKIPVRTSQETHYASATESSRLMLCKI
jgi:hypothetical protein